MLGGMRNTPALLLLLALCLTCGHAVRPLSLETSATASLQEQHAIVKKVAAPKPPLDDGAAMSRWLMHETQWGTLATVDEDAWPVSGVVVHADGPSGRLFFYMTPKDELTANLLVEPHVSYTVSEEQTLPNGCDGANPMDPRCARVAMLGSMHVVEGEEVAIARAAVFGRHPEMAAWPAGHGFDFFELHVRDIHLLDWYGGMKVVTPEEYYACTWYNQAV